jgi:ATP-dependent RNA helicase SUPV3L1/SUV3
MMEKAACQAMGVASSWGMTDHRLVAVLGPTNTGKTHLALERMLGHASGMIGFPLRLLARENYEKAASLKGRQAVALVTGEEKIVPRSARYFFCTVEAMPLDRAVAFLAVDEIQLMADPERGHIFTARMLHARGTLETMFMGSPSAGPVLRALLPDITFIDRPRFSALTHSGHRKLTRLPPRTAVVAFSADELYRIADLLRSQRGGAALVLGALSPRARNAQVGLYQSGEVDYLIATDAIGMGLNLDVHHIAFASQRKYDGQNFRPLTLAEMSQIAGRAGRHVRDGTFGTTATAEPFDEAQVRALEDYRFEPLPRIYWRQEELDFRSGEHLLRALDTPAAHPFLLRQGNGEDHRALLSLLREPAIRARALGVPATRLLWDVCQIPDFRKLLNDSHVRLLEQIYLQLLRGAIPEDWLASQLAALDKTEGDIDLLMQRLAHIRTFSFITHRHDWVKEAEHWQGMSRLIEDRLSDALHEALTQRFIDKRRTSLARRLKDGAALSGYIDADGTVFVENHPAGRLRLWRFEAAETDATWRRPLMQAARTIIRPAIQQSISELLGVQDFRLDDAGALFWRDAEIARLIPGGRPFSPRLKLSDADEHLLPAERISIERHLAQWLARHLEEMLRPLLALERRDLPSDARGLAYRLVENFGALDRDAAAPQCRHLTREGRLALARAGVKFGALTIRMRGLAKARPLLALLCELFHGRQPENAIAPHLIHFARGQRVLAGKFYSFGEADRIARLIFAAVPVRADDALARKIGVGVEELVPLALVLRLRVEKSNGAYVIARTRRRRTPQPLPSPAFAALAGWQAKASTRKR